MQEWGAGKGVKYYHVLFSGPVSGLAKTSYVLFNGIQVGRVRDYEIDQRDARKRAC